MSLSDPIKHIIESHKNGVSGDKVRPVDYWRKKVSKIIHDNNDHHHIGQYYAREGMWIDIKTQNPQARELISVMNYIKEKLSTDKTSENVAKLIGAFGGIYQQNSQKKTAQAADSLLETYIKAIAVSILSETNGNSKLAKDLLENGGMDLVKNFNTESMKNLLEQLKDISADPERQR